MEVCVGDALGLTGEAVAEGEAELEEDPLGDTGDAVTEGEELDDGEVDEEELGLTGEAVTEGEGLLLGVELRGTNE